MQTTVDLPEPLYRRSVDFATSRGVTIEEFIVEAVAKEVDTGVQEVRAGDGRGIVLPVIRSSRPGTLDLATFNFDELLG